MSPAYSSQQFPAHFRLKRNVDFQRTYKRRQTASDGNLLLFACENGLPYPRLGLSVSRKVGSAVVRNRWKRRLREAFRLSLPDLPAGLDLVVIPRAAREPAWEDLPRSLCSLARRLATRINKARP